MAREEGRGGDEIKEHARGREECMVLAEVQM